MTDWRVGWEICEHLADDGLLKGDVNEENRRVACTECAANGFLTADELTPVDHIRCHDAEEPFKVSALPPQA